MLDHGLSAPALASYENTSNTRGLVQTAASVSSAVHVPPALRREPLLTHPLGVKTPRAVITR